MNSPYMGNFKITQVQHANHDGLDLVGIDNKEIHATINGTVERAGWEDAGNAKQGFGLYVRIKKDGTEDRYYFGHMSEVCCKVGDHVNITDVIGIEGSTGNSSGSHCHYCCRGSASKEQVKDICAISGIPNAAGVYNDGYTGAYKGPEPAEPAAPAQPKNGVTMLRNGDWNVRKGPSLDSAVARVVKGPQSVTFVDVVDGFYKLRDGNYISVKACI